MDILKIQQELLKSLVKDQKGSYFYDSATRVFVTTTGKVGYFINEADLQVKLTGAQTMMAFNLDDVVCPDNLLVGTDEYRIGGTVRKYRNDDVLREDTYVATGLLKYFDNPKLYQAENPLSPIVVTEDLYGVGEQYIVGVVMPHKVKTE